MRYDNIQSGRFLERPNRFIAYVEINGKREKVHVKNTGRCKELLQPGALVYLVKSDREERSTAYDLVAVEKGKRLVNIDSQAPNKVVGEWLKKKELFPELSAVRPETVYGNSRFDFYIENGEEKIFLEVKGVTLEENGVVSFPDAPSDRAVKHVEELIEAKKNGYRVFVLFVVQMQDVRWFEPNREIHPEFAEALCRAAEAGVEMVAYDCLVGTDTLHINRPVPIRLRGSALAEVPGRLLCWYDANRRVLPWREEPTPYHVWVSEIMLQQTRVEAVKPYYARFMKALPDIRALAETGEEQLLKLWEGLGYYNRVRNLQKAAIQIIENYGGVMPSDFEELLKLTGIGRYTAGAISSIAYGQPNPAVDGNVLRVLSRLRMDDRLISEEKVRLSVEKDLAELIPEDRPGDFNQAMMEIGACVCIPNGAPLCDRCPLEDICKAHLSGMEREYPKKAQKAPRTVEKKTVLVICDENKTVVQKRKNHGLLAGMYEFPGMTGHRTPEEVTAYLAENGIKVVRILPLADTKHIFTHKEWHMKGYMIRADELEHGELKGEAADWIYIDPEETAEKYPIPSAFSAYAKMLNMRQGMFKEQ